MKLLSLDHIRLLTQALREHINPECREVWERHHISVYVSSRFDGPSGTDNIYVTAVSEDDDAGHTIINEFTVCPMMGNLREQFSEFGNTVKNQLKLL